jgi:cob(I)alamin adenosyltransferase
MKIYTKTGDRGETGLLGGVRVPKDHLAVTVCGDLDEANSVIGVVLAEGVSQANREELIRVQQDLFGLGSVVAAEVGQSRRRVPLERKRISDLEQGIDRMEESLPPMDAFILPGGGRVSALAHWARTVVRRAERNIVTLVRELKAENALENELVYLNRLSDFLFVLARFENFRLSGREQKWLPTPQDTCQKNGDSL